MFFMEACEYSEEFFQTELFVFLTGKRQNEEDGDSRAGFEIFLQMP